MIDPHSDSRPNVPPGALFRLAQRLFLFKARITRGMTLGVRGVVLDDHNRVFLVRHSYIAGWHLPGGGVEPGETLQDALAKELREEGNILVQAPGVLLSMCFNRLASSRDHVAVFVVRNFQQTAPRGADHEILEAGFYPIDALPPATTEGTRRRIAEALGQRQPDGLW